jgi:hypothetical protein
MNTPDCILTLLKNKALAAFVPCKSINKAAIDKLLPEGDTLTLSKTMVGWILYERWTQRTPWKWLLWPDWDPSTDLCSDHRALKMPIMQRSFLSNWIQILPIGVENFGIGRHFYRICHPRAAALVTPPPVAVLDTWHLCDHMERFSGLTNSVRKWGPIPKLSITFGKLREPKWPTETSNRKIILDQYRVKFNQGCVTS